MMINLIWAMDKNCLIGKGNKLPWKIPAETKYFSQITSGNTVLMGAKTFESIGKPLKNRYNIVITKNPEKYRHWQEKKLIFTANWKEILEPYKGNLDKHIFIIGGRKIYQQTYILADFYYISVIKKTYEGNVKFPFPGWKENESQGNPSFEKLFEGCKLIKKKEFSDFTAYVYAQTKTSLLSESKKMSMKNYLTWTEYFISIAKLVSRRSKDPNTQVGAVIINPQTNTIISTGYNGFPRGCQDDKFPWGNDSKNWLETKYPYVVHAEANAIIHAQQNCAGFTMYTNFFPCHECAKLIIQSGIRNVFYYSNSLSNQEQWRNSYLASEKMFQASSVNCQKVKT